MGKISSSDLPPHQTDDDRTALQKFLSKKSQHFEPGTWIVRDNVRGLVQTRDGGTLTVSWEDGIVSSIKPIAINR